jgi:hypothetical protein
MVSLELGATFNKPNTGWINQGPSYTTNELIPNLIGSILTGSTAKEIQTLTKPRTPLYTPLASEEGERLIPARFYEYFKRAIRRCPGIHFADQSLWCAIASFLACFDISPETAADGSPILPELAFAPGTFR